MTHDDEKDPIDARIEGLQERVRELRQELATARKERPPEPIDDYEFVASTGESVRLAALFGDKPELIVVHNMGKQCPMCTMWADGLNGLRVHLENRCAFVVSTPDDPETQRAFADSRGWTFRMVSTRGTSFAPDLGFAGEHDGKLMRRETPRLSLAHG